MKRKPAGFSTTGLVHGELEMMRKMAYIYIKAGA